MMMLKQIIKEEIKKIISENIGELRGLLDNPNPHNRRKIFRYYMEAHGS